MTKFKVLENVEVIVSQSPHFGQKGKVVYLFDTGKYLVQMNGCFIEAADYALRSLGNEQNPPFNLEQFKAGIPAITRDGRVAEFVTKTNNNHYPIVAVIGNHRTTYTSEGYCSMSGETMSDLVSMQVTQSTPEQVIPAQPSKSIDEKRYKWFSQYIVSELVIDSLEEELVACKAKSELDKVLDKYSAMITFNKP